MKLPTFVTNLQKIKSTMKKFILSALFLAVVVTAGAVPAKRYWRSFQQVDGSQIQLMLVGDEHMHYYVTTDNQPVVKNENGFYYATITDDGLRASNVLAHNEAERSTTEKESLSKISETRPLIAKAYARSKELVHKANIGTPTGDLTGEKKGIVVLASFSDLDFTVPNPKQAFTAMCNTEGYNENGAVGSVHDYFHDSSRGVFDLTFDVYGPYKAPNRMAYYGANNDAKIKDLIKFAVTQAANEAGNDFSEYDWDNDGFVDQVYVVYAGYSEASGAGENTIWPHESELGYNYFYDNTVKVGEKRVNTYACGSELSGTTGSNMEGIGTMCHEFSHCLGLPDLYDISSNQQNSNPNYGMFIWDIMDQGPYNSDGKIPPTYTGYERKFCGWLDYRELDPEKPCWVKGLKSLENGGEVYQIKNPNDGNEYYLIENRYAGTKWDRGLADYMGSTSAGGLLITHITFEISRWRNNDVNVTDSKYTNTGKSYAYQGCTPLLADNNPKNSYIESNGAVYLNPTGISGDLWGTNRHTTLSATYNACFCMEFLHWHV